MNARDTLKALDEQRAKVLEDAKAAAFQKAQEAIGELRELGFHYSLIETARPSPPTASGPEHSGPGEAAAFDQSMFGS